MAKTFSIRVATSDDHDDILDFVREHYYKEEPLTLSHPIPGHTKDDEDFTMSHLKHQTVQIATDEESGKIVGVIVAGPIEPGDADAMIEAAKTTETKKWRDISLLLAYIEKKADVLRRFDKSIGLHVHALGVHSQFRGHRLGEKLFNSCFDNAKRLNYSMVTADCTSIYSSRIAEKLGMESVSLMTYDEYNESIGEKLFQPTEPNVSIKTFAKFF